MTLLGAASAAALGIAAGGLAAPFPPITYPPTSVHHPGMLTWADLFTSSPDTAAKFYCDLLGWTSTVIDQKGRPYTVFSNAGTPVAGIAPHSPGKQDRPSRWVGYVSVTDINAVVAAAHKAGGVVHAKARSFPDRGLQAIIGDGEKTPIGLLQSTSGDPEDDEPEPGEWNWFELYSKDPAAASEFYHTVLGYDVAPETHSDRKSEFVLSSSGNPRGGIALLPDSREARPGWLGVVRVADIDKTLEKVGGLGGHVLVEPRPAEFGSRFAIVQDPTGGTIGLVQYVEGENPAKAP